MSYWTSRGLSTTVIDIVPALWVHIGPSCETCGENLMYRDDLTHTSHELPLQLSECKGSTREKEQAAYSVSDVQILKGQRASCVA